MASRVLDVLFRLRDQFTGRVKAVTGQFQKVGDAAERAGRRSQRAFDNLGGSANRLLGVLTRVGAAFGVAIGIRQSARALGDFADEADRIAKIGEKLGITAEELDRIGFVAERNGIAFNAASVGIQRFTRRLDEVAKTGKGTAAKALEELGVSAADLNRLPIEDKLARLADAFAVVEDQGSRVRLAFSLFDTEGVDLVRILQNGSVAFRQLSAEAAEFGETLNEKATKEAARFNDLLTNFQRRTGALTLDVKTESLELANALLESLELGTTAVENEQRRLNQLYTASTALLKSGVPVQDERIAGIEREIESIRVLRRERLETLRLQQQEQATSQAESREAATRTAVRSGLIESLKGQAAEQEKILDKETQDLADARKRQLSIEKEFAERVREITAPPEAEEVSGLDVQAQVNEARRRIAEGDARAAVEVAREGFDLLGRLKEQGEESGFVISFLAKELQRVAGEASRADVRAEVIDEQQAVEAINKINAQIQSVDAVPIKVDQQSLTEFTATLTGAIEVAGTAGLRRAFEQAPAGFNFASAIEKAGVK